MSNTFKNILLLNTPAGDKTINRDMAGGMGFSAGEGVVLPPLDLLVMASVLRNAGYNVKFIDAIADRMDDPAEIYGFCGNNNIETVIATLSLPTYKDDCAFFKAFNSRLPLVSIIIVTAINDPEILEVILRESSAKIIIYSECDVGIVNCVEGKECPGTATIKNDGLSIVPPLMSMPDMNKAPIPARDLLTPDKYKYVLLPGKVTTMHASKGCPFPCAYYCPHPLVQGKKWRSLTPERVIEEMISIKRLGYDSVFFRDSVFTLDAARTESICELIIQNKLKLNWWCESRVNVLGVALMKKMSEAGCLGINVGIETLDQGLISSQGKPGVKLDDVIAVRNAAQSVGIKLHFLMIVGLPDESVKTLHTSFKYIMYLKPETIGVTIITPYPGTALYKDAVKDGLLSSKDWRSYNGTIANMHTKYLSEAELKFGRFLLMSASFISRKNKLVGLTGKIIINSVFNIWKMMCRGKV